MLTHYTGIAWLKIIKPLIHCIQFLVVAKRSSPVSVTRRKDWQSYAELNVNQATREWENHRHIYVTYRRKEKLWWNPFQRSLSTCIINSILKISRNFILSREPFHMTLSIIWSHDLTNIASKNLSSFLTSCIRLKSSQFVCNFRMLKKSISELFAVNY